MRLRRFGEFNLIRLIQRKLAAKASGVPVIVGLGDDAFVGALSKQHLLVTTNDVLIENIHFKQGWITPWQLGYKSMAVNLSDLAAMGKCRPLYGIVGLGLPGDITVDFVDKLYTGMNKIADKYGLRIVGGDTVFSRKDIVISITLIGEIKKKYLVTRSCAKPGDIIAVTGTFGDSAGGLYLLSKGTRKGPHFVDYLIKKHLLPEPRLRESSKLASTGKITSLIDSSDGLATSVKFIRELSRVGARIDIDRIPLSPELRKLGAEDKKVNPLTMALAGGEEYELVFTTKPKDFPLLKKVVSNITPVGKIVPGKEITYYFHGHPQKISNAGFEHFK